MPKPETRYQGKSINDTRYPLRGRVGGTGVAVPRYKDRRVTGVWDMTTRPGFWEDTIKTVLAGGNWRVNAQTLHKEYECKKCKNYFHRKKKLTYDEQKAQGFITIDHKIPWQIFTLKNARPKLDGSISTLAAREAYNTVTNLVALCNSCNSSKNGYMES